MINFILFRKTDLINRTQLIAGFFVSVIVTVLAIVAARTALPGSWQSTAGLATICIALIYPLIWSKSTVRPEITWFMEGLTGIPGLIYASVFWTGMVLLCAVLE